MQGVGFASMVAPETALGAFLCCECGLCSGFFACPMGLSPDRYNAQLKRQLRARGVKPPQGGVSPPPRGERQTKRVPVETLIRRLALERYRRPAPLQEQPAVVPRVRIALVQGTGAPAEPVVRAGQKVRQGDVLAEAAAGRVSARVHASISGTVTRIDAEAITIEA